MLEPATYPPDDACKTWAGGLIIMRPDDTYFFGKDLREGEEQDKEHERSADGQHLPLL